MALEPTRLDRSDLRLNTEVSTTRQTPKTDFGSVLSNGLDKTADALLGAGSAAAPFVPGGVVISSAISNLSAAKNAASQSSALTSGGAGYAGGTGSTGYSGGSSGSSGIGNVDNGGALPSAGVAAGGGDGFALLQATKSMQEQNQAFNLQYLQLQENMQADSRQYTAVSNIMKTKHDSAKNAINNLH